MLRIQSVNRKAVIWACGCVFVLCAVSISFAEEVLETYDVNGTKFEVLQPTDVEFDIDNNTLVLTAPEGKLAKMNILREKQLTEVQGVKITVWTETESFQIEGSAQIKQGTDIMIGPKGVSFDGKTGVLEVMGSKEKPAKLNVKNETLKYQGNAEQFNLQFAEVDGARKLKKFRTIGNMGSDIIDTAGKGMPVFFEREDEKDGGKAQSSDKGKTQPEGPGRKISQ